MGSKSDTWEVDVLKILTGQTPTNYIVISTAIVPYVALFTVPPTDSTPGTEVIGGGYTRISSAGKWNAPTPGAGSMTNSAQILFPTASADWGTIQAFAIMSSPSGANYMLMWGSLTTAKAVQSGDTPSFAATTLTLTED